MQSFQSCFSILTTVELIRQLPSLLLKKPSLLIVFTISTNLTGWLEGPKSLAKNRRGCITLSWRTHPWMMMGGSLPGVTAEGSSTPHLNKVISKAWGLLEWNLPRKYCCDWPCWSCIFSAEAFVFQHLHFSKAVGTNSPSWQRTMQQRTFREMFDASLELTLNLESPVHASYEWCFLEETYSLQFHSMQWVTASAKCGCKLRAEFLCVLPVWTFTGWGLQRTSCLFPTQHCLVLDGCLGEK